MTHTKYTWTETSPITAYAMNNLEGQYSELVTIFDAHTHPDTHYTKTESDDKFFNASLMGDGSGFDADKLDGSHFSDIVGSIMPKGAILIWSSTDGDIPTGWGICNGSTYGTIVSPDLRDRFIFCSGNVCVPGNTGGPGAFDGLITPTGSINVGDHILTADEIPVHTHEYTDYYAALTVYRSALQNIQMLYSIPTLNKTAGEQAVGDGAHGHTGSTITFDGVDARPNFISVYYIIKY